MKYNSLRLKAELDRVDFGVFDADGNKIGGKRITRYQTHEQVFRDNNIQSIMTDKAIIRPTLVEIAIDIWGGRDEVLPFLADMVANSKLPLREVRAFLPYAKEMRRPKCKGETIKLTHRAQLLETLQAGGTLYLGNQRDWRGCERSPVSVRAYWKMTDGQKDKEAIDLGPEEHRGRFEIVIQRDGLTAARLSDVTDWQSWTVWNVTKAAKHFAQLVPDAGPAIKALGCRTHRPRPGARRDTVTEIGKHNTNALRASRRQETGSNTAPRLFSGRSNCALSRAILEALRVLDRRLKRGGLGEKSGLFSGETPPLNDDFPEAKETLEPAPHKASSSAGPHVVNTPADARLFMTNYIRLEGTLRQERRNKETKREDTTEITTKIIGGVSANPILRSNGKGVVRRQVPGDFRLDPPPQTRSPREMDRPFYPFLENFFLP